MATVVDNLSGAAASLIVGVSGAARSVSTSSGAVVRLLHGAVVC